MSDDLTILTFPALPDSFPQSYDSVSCSGFIF